jgi:hypothetical protein
MSPKTSLALHIVPALALPLTAVALSSVGNVDSFQNWLLGYAQLSTRTLPLLAACVVGIAIMVHYFAATSDGLAFKAVMGGALIGLLTGIIASTAVGISPLLVATLTAIGGAGGWAFLPRR